MIYTPSPLRYPGGKSSIFPMVSGIITDNLLNGGHYIEPYAGGGGLALLLLFRQYVHEIHLNDLDRSVWAFWHSVLNDTDRFIDKIQSTDITAEEWHQQRKIQENKDTADSFDLGFSTFFLNRTNRSGIILKAGMIGGYEQSGNYKLDCRFNKESLIAKIVKIAEYKHRIHIYNRDAIDFIQAIDSELPKKSLFNIDPPYFGQGSSLYTNFYKPEDHQRVSQTILNITHPWILTYDYAPEIEQLYSDSPRYLFSLNYSVQRKRKGQELLMASNSLIIADHLGLDRVS